MAIKILRQGPPIIGYAKIGANHPKDSTKKGAPYKFDHIELAGRDRDTDGNLVPNRDLMEEILRNGVPTCGGCQRSKTLGFPEGLPTRIPILITFNDLELAFPNRLALYRGRTAYCVGDGESAQRLTITGKRKVGSRDIPTYGPYAEHSPCGPSCPDFSSTAPGRCKPNGKLRFALGTQDVVGGVMEFRTTSWASIANLQSGLEAVKHATGGFIQGIPLFLDIVEETVIPKDGGPAGKAQIARIVPVADRAGLLQLAAETLRLRAPLVAEVRALEASIDRGATWDETEEEIEAIEQEFYPDGEAPTPEPAEASAPEADSEPIEGRTEELGASEPAPADKLPEVREGDDRPVITDGQMGLLVAKAEMRCGKIGYDPSYADTLISEVLVPLGIGSVRDVRLPEMNDVLSGVTSYEVTA